MNKLGLWEKSYLDLIEKLSNKLDPYSYADILNTEGEYKMLLNFVKKHQYLLEQHLNTLSKKYPQETYELYYNYLIKDAGMASSRKEYRSVCRKISELYNAGGKEKAKQLVAYLKSKYLRRPAF